MTLGERSNLRLSWQHVLLIALPILIGFGLLQWYLSCVQPDVAYMDTLRLLHQNQAYSEGRLRLFELWNQGQHRGLIFQAVLALNVHFFDLDVVLADRLTPVMIGLEAMLLCLAFRRDLDRLGTPWSPAIPGFYFVCVALLFSLAGWELYILDLGLAQHLKNLLFVGYFIGFDAFLRQTRSGAIAGVGLAVSGIVLVGFIGMGWSYSFLVALAAMFVAQALRPRPDRLGWLLRAGMPLLAITAALAISILVAGGIGNSGESGPSWFAERLRDAGIVKGLLMSLGTSVLGVEMVSARPWLFLPTMLLGAGVLVAAVIALVARWRDRRAGLSLVPIALIVYGLSFAVSIALARGFSDPFMAAASRYYMDNVLTLVGIAWCAFGRFAFSPVTMRDVRGMAILAAGVVLMLGVTATNADEWRKAKWRRWAFEDMHAVALAGIANADQARTLQSPLADAQAGVALQQRQLLGVYSDFPRVCENASVRPLTGWYAGEGSGGRVAGKAVLLASPCRCGLRIEGRLLDLFPGRDVAFERDGQVLQTLSLRPGEAFSVRLPGWDTGVGRIAIRVSSMPPAALEQARLGALGLAITKIETGCP